MEEEPCFSLMGGECDFFSFSAVDLCGVTAVGVTVRRTSPLKTSMTALMRRSSWSWSLSSMIMVRVLALLLSPRKRVRGMLNGHTQTHQRTYWKKDVVVNATATHAVCLINDHVLATSVMAVIFRFTLFFCRRKRSWQMLPFYGIVADRDLIERKLKKMFFEPKTNMIIIHTLYVFIFCKFQREKIISLESKEKRGD